MSKKNKGSKATPSKANQGNALVQEYIEREGEIKSLYQSYTGTKAGLTDGQREEIGRLWSYYSDKVFLRLESYKEKKIRSSFSFLSYVCNLPLPKGIDYSSTEDFCRTNAESYYNDVKARQMRLIRLAELAGHKTKKVSTKTEVSPLERVTKMILGAKSSWEDKDRRTLLNSLMAYFKKMAVKQVGKVKKVAAKGKPEAVEQDQIAA